MEKLYYTIGEAADILGESTSLVRFWSNSFPKYIKPKRNAKGNRLFTAEDLDCLKQIHLLVKEQGLTLEGAARKMAGDRKTVDGRVKVLDSLKEIRRQLVDVKNPCEYESKGHHLGHRVVRSAFHSGGLGQQRPCHRITGAGSPRSPSGI